MKELNNIMEDSSYKNNQLFKEIGALLPFLLFTYIINQFLIEIKYYTTKYFFRHFFYFTNKRILLKNLFENGFCVIKKYYDKYEIEQINNYLNIIQMNKETQYSIKIQGTQKISRLENNKFISRFSNDLNLIIINFIFNWKFEKPTVKALFTKKIKFGKQHILASHPHFDSYKHELKILVPLNNISKKNGPTQFNSISGRFFLKYFKQYFVSWLQVKGFVKKNNMNIIPKYIFSNNFTLEFTADIGDIVIFDSRFIHRASEIREKYRSILWFYFS